MSELVVVATPASTPGFRLGGARTLTARDAQQAEAAVRQATQDCDAGVIAVHAELWAQLPKAARGAWAKQAAPLVIALPDHDGEIAAARDAELRDLLARAVGYQITFTAEGGSS